MASCAAVLTVLLVDIAANDGSELVTVKLFAAPVAFELSIKKVPASAFIIFAVTPKLPLSALILSLIALKSSDASMATLKLLLPAAKVNVPLPNVVDEDATAADFN